MEVYARAVRAHEYIIVDSRRTSATLAASSGEAQDRISEMPGRRTAPR